MKPSASLHGCVIIFTNAPNGRWVLAARGSIDALFGLLFPFLAASIERKVRRKRNALIKNAQIHVKFMKEKKVSMEFSFSDFVVAASRSPAVVDRLVFNFRANTRRNEKSVW